MDSTLANQVHLSSLITQFNEPLLYLGNKLIIERVIIVLEKELISCIYNIF